MSKQVGLPRIGLILQRITIGPGAIYAIFVQKPSIDKQYNLYSCRWNKFLPSIKVFNSKIKIIHQLETMIAKSNNKLKAHNMKRGKYKNK